MKKFYLHNGNEQSGPFDLNELREKKIIKNTPIWYEGISDWTNAENVDELKDLFKSTTPPPFKKNIQAKPVKKSYRIWQIFRWSFIIVVFGFVGITILVNYCSGNGRGGSYQEKVMTVEEIERADPARFLSADGTYNMNFWEDKFKVHGVVKNSATVANYKDVVVEIIYYSGTNTELDRDRYTIYDYFPAHSEKNFELVVNIPKACKKLGWEAVEATPN
jgi:hypothetical protein